MEAPRRRRDYKTERVVVSQAPRCRLLNFEPKSPIARRATSASFCRTAASSTPSHQRPPPPRPSQQRPPPHSGEATRAIPRSRLCRPDPGGAARGQMWTTAKAVAGLVDSWGRSSPRRDYPRSIQTSRVEKISICS
ncbi:hypothetical protein PAHAL_1G442900 [Panicum hallii]|uniref:Uncharacterized protein n=1 Tax=Panicum hallii TaxID=206008 RepID=A0A2T8KYB0_9POAL|nr:hypothetical protein PAHAL_1G442900 [Panicum hallii]PVH67164.1 hypothetical protein PAHAL_1G442900 [Panicum hallii]PVH67165.1 hypothetical protein PAHAL_1G442900 [Panicum hallii]PVH67166.1 hypothetical protein PAHAL_1G442900 [Panicum hallii]